MPGSLHPDVADFVRQLSEFQTFLANNQQGFWAEKIRDVKERAAQSDVQSVPQFQNCLGGMGSLNDLWF